MKLFSLTLAAALSLGTVSLASPVLAGQYGAFRDYNAFKADCDAHNGTIVNGPGGSKDCHAGGQPITVPSPTNGLVQANFEADCASNGGKVYTAAEWNALGMAPHLVDGQLKCHREASFGPDIK